MTTPTALLASGYLALCRVTSLADVAKGEQGRLHFSGRDVTALLTLQQVAEPVTCNRCDDPSCCDAALAAMVLQPHNRATGFLGPAYRLPLLQAYCSAALPWLWPPQLSAWFRSP